MSRIVALGADVVVAGFGLAGVLVVPAEGADEVRAAWRALPADVDLVILTPEAAEVLPEPEPDGPLVAVIPR